MRQICHLPRTREGLEKASKRGLRYYHTVCGTVAVLSNLVPKEMCDCGTCLIRSEETVKAQTVHASAPAETEGVDLSEWSEIGALDSPLQASTSTVHPTVPPPMAQVSYEELCTRLGMNPDSDPNGRLGTPDFDIREVLTNEERTAAAPILGMVKSLPMGAPLVQIVHRLCHELAWRRAMASR